MKSAKLGFTLVELTVVIVILGVLAVTAAPRFLNLQRDARVSAVMGAKAAMEDAARFAYAKAVIEGVEGNPRTTIPDDGSNDGTPPALTNLGYLELKYGYPESYAEYGLGILDLVNLGSTDFDNGDQEVCFSRDCDKGNSSVVRVGYVFPLSYDVDDKPGCYALYGEPESNAHTSNDIGDETPNYKQAIVLVNTQAC